MKDNKTLVSEILELFDTNQKDTRDRLEIYANVMILEGFRTIPDEFLPESVTISNLAHTILDLKNKLGERIDIAMIQQGLVLLMWLEERLV